MKRALVLFLLLIIVGAFGCAGPRYAERGATVGMFGGAALGAIGGAAAGNPALGALIGAGAGAFSGAIIGEALEEERYRGFMEGRATVYRSKAIEETSRARPLGDPTQGEIINETPWELRIFLDPGAGPLERPDLVLSPRERRPVGLDIGPHRIVAKAIVNTQFGPREVGTYEERITIDPRGSGWSLRLSRDFF